MKKTMWFVMIVFLSVWFTIPLHAGIFGDINNDGKVSLEEAVFALQVAAGLYPELSDSCVLTGKGEWAGGETYTICDVVKHSGFTYACIKNHTAAVETNEPPNDALWTLLSIKGEKGDKGDTGDKFRHPDIGLQINL